VSEPEDGSLTLEELDRRWKGKHERA